MECIGSNQRYDTHTLSVLFFSFFFFFFFLLQLTFFVFSVQQNNATVTSPFTARFGVKGYEVVPASTEF